VKGGKNGRDPASRTGARKGGPALTRKATADRNVQLGIKNVAEKDKGSRMTRTLANEEAHSDTGGFSIAHHHDV